MEILGAGQVRRQEGMFSFLCLLRAECERKEPESYLKWGGCGALELFPVLVWLMLIDSVISPAPLAQLLEQG